MKRRAPPPGSAAAHAAVAVSPNSATGGAGGGVPPISPARRSEYERRIAECKAKKAAYRRASAVFHDAGRKYKTALSRWQHEWAGNVTNAKKMLGVPTNATEEEIKSAYRRAAKLYHPDRAEGNGLTVEEATRAFRQIQEAYEVLCAVFVNRVRS